MDCYQRIGLFRHQREGFGGQDATAKHRVSLLGPALQRQKPLACQRSHGGLCDAADLQQIRQKGTLRAGQCVQNLLLKLADGAGIRPLNRGRVQPLLEPGLSRPHGARQHGSNTGFNRRTVVRRHPLRQLQHPGGDEGRLALEGDNALQIGDGGMGGERKDVPRGGTSSKRNHHARTRNDAPRQRFRNGIVKCPVQSNVNNNLGNHAAFPALTTGPQKKGRRRPAPPSLRSYCPNHGMA